MVQKLTMAIRVCVYGKEHQDNFTHAQVSTRGHDDIIIAVWSNDGDVIMRSWYVGTIQYMYSK